MSKSFRTEAIVLRKKSLLDRDVLVILFTETDGKTAAVAKGLRKLTSRRSPHLQTGNLVTVQLNPRGDRRYLDSTSLISGFSGLKKESAKINAMYGFLFILERLLPEHQVEHEVYILTKRFLVDLTKAGDPRSHLTSYLNRLLKLLGYSTEDHGLKELEDVISELINDKIPSFDI